jgi:hypothetical protein
LFAELSATSYFIVSYTADPFCGFTTVQANAIAIIDKVTAVQATKLIFLTHQLRLCNLLCGVKEILSFPKILRGQILVGVFLTH